MLNELRFPELAKTRNKTVYVIFIAQTVITGILLALTTACWGLAHLVKADIIGREIYSFQLISVLGDVGDFAELFVGHFPLMYFYGMLVAFPIAVITLAFLIICQIADSKSKPFKDKRLIPIFLSPAISIAYFFLIIQFEDLMI